MAQAPNSSSGSGKGGGASKGGSTSSKQGTGKQTISKSGKSDPILSNANQMPITQARKGQSGEYTTKGKWANWSDGTEVFKG